MLKIPTTKRSVRKKANVWLVATSLVFLTIVVFYNLEARKTIRDESKGNQSMQSQELPSYQKGTTRTVKTVQIGPSGGTLNVEGTGTPADGIKIRIPPGALDKTVLVSLGYNDGQLQNLQAGKPSGRTLVLFTEPDVKQFTMPATGESVQITVKYDNRTNPKVISTYVINNLGKLEPLQLLSLDNKQHEATFGTFKPIMFTWVYVY